VIAATSTLVVGTIVYSQSERNEWCVPGKWDEDALEHTAEYAFKVVTAYLTVTALVAVPVPIMLVKAASGHLRRVAYFGFMVWLTQVWWSLREITNCYSPYPHNDTMLWINYTLSLLFMATWGGGALFQAYLFYGRIRELEGALCQPVGLRWSGCALIVSLIIFLATLLLPRSPFVMISFCVCVPVAIATGVASFVRVARMLSKGSKLATGHHVKELKSCRQALYWQLGGVITGLGTSWMSITCSHIVIMMGILSCGRHFFVPGRGGSPSDPLEVHLYNVYSQYRVAVFCHVGS